MIKSVVVISFSYGGTMNLNQLEYFVSAAETLNFTKAAEKCFISQTAMTQQIRALENQVGVALFIRDKHHVELTTAGRVYLKEARAILERSNEALRLARTAASGEEGKITIGFIKGYGLDELFGTVRNFHDAYPNIRISLLRENSSGLLGAMERGECDAAFTLMTFRQDAREFGHAYVKSFPLMVALYPGHRLAGKKTLTYSDLEGEDFIIMQPAGRAKDEAEESMLIYERGGFFPNVVALEGDPETLLLMISTGLGISILPEYVIRLYKSSPDLVLLPLVKDDGSAETQDLELVWPVQNTNPAVGRLAGLI